MQNGPGATNLLTNAAAARACHAPMVIMGGAPMVGQVYKDATGHALPSMSSARGWGWISARPATAVG